MSRDESTPPWAIPVSLGEYFSPSTTPAVSQAFMTCRSAGFVTIAPRGVFPLVLLRYAAHGQQTGCLRFHQALLQVISGLFVTTLRGLRDLLLHAHHLLLQRAPGQALPRLLRVPG